MKLCHAAALALVGWYLMEPPPMMSVQQIVRQQQGLPPLPGHSAPEFYDAHAQFTEWSLISSWDTAAACQAEKVRLFEEPPGHEPFSETIVGSQCIASEDPRLKEK
jgi:hypothetical protein